MLTYMGKKYYDSEDIAALTDLNVQTVRRWARKDLTFRDMSRRLLGHGRTYYWPVADFDTWLAERNVTMAGN